MRVAAWELQEAIENFEIETMYGFEPITHGGMGADNKPVDIMGESSLATINAEMNEAMVTIVVEGNRKAQMQALQGQMLASMGAVKFDVGLSAMTGIQDQVHLIGTVSGGTLGGLAQSVNGVLVPHGGPPLTSNMFTVSNDAYLIVAPRENSDKILMFNNLGDPVSELKAFSSQPYRVDLATDFSNGSFPNNQFYFQVTPQDPVSVFSIKIFGSWGQQGTGSQTRPSFYDR